jgi:hypothetical protein
MSQVGPLSGTGLPALQRGGRAVQQVSLSVDCPRRQPAANGSQGGQRGCCWWVMEMKVVPGVWSVVKLKQQLVPLSMPSTITVTLKAWYASEGLVMHVTWAARSARVICFRSAQQLTALTTVSDDR